MNNHNLSRSSCSAQRGRIGGTATKLKPNSVVLHSRQDDVIPFSDAVELVTNSGLPPETLIQVGSDHRLADPEPLRVARCDEGELAANPRRLVRCVQGTWQTCFARLLSGMNLDIVDSGTVIESTPLPTHFIFVAASGSTIPIKRRVPNGVPTPLIFLDPP